MKTKMVRNQVYNLNGTNKIITIGYANLDSVLKYFNPIGYNAGIYGWNYDVYDLLGYTFVTGYRPLGNRADYDLTKKYEELGKELSSLRDWTEKKARALELLEEFVEELER